jgi:spoIIIJ-associated protein
MEPESGSDSGIGPDVDEPADQGIPSLEEGSSDRPGLGVDDELEEQADAVADFLEELLERMGIDAIAEPAAHAGHVYVDIVDGPEEDMALLIGRHGQTLDAIQELARTAVGRRLDQRIRVLVDVEDYRKRQDDRLMEQARETAERVLASGEPAHLEPMNAYARKLVHDAVAEIEGVESDSEGVDPERHVVIRPV